MSTRNFPSFHRSCRPLLLSVLILLLILSAGNSHSGDSEPCALPEDYGEVVCRFNEKSPNQLFIIGLSHVADIIKYLRENRITVLSPLFAPLKHSDYVDPLNLAKEDFGISVIIPRTLLDDGGGMEKNRLKALVQTIPSPG